MRVLTGVVMSIGLAGGVLGTGYAVASCGAESDITASCPSDAGQPTVGTSADLVCDGGSCDPGSCTFPMGVPHHASDSLWSMRQACAFGPDTAARDAVGTDPTLSLGPGASMPGLDHVVLLMLENRGFDHLFADLQRAGVTDVDLADPNTVNPDGDGGVVRRFHDPKYCEPNDAEHDWAQAHLAYAGGAMDGFVAASQAPNPMAYYRECDLPVAYSLAKTFAISDRYFSSLLGPTTPNRLFSVLATSCGFAEGDDSNVDVSECALKQTSILGQLADANQSHQIYDESGITSLYTLLAVAGPPQSFDDFRSAVHDGSLPKLSIVNANNGELTALYGPENDDHPNHDVRLGEIFLYAAVEALATSPLWSSTALFITYDENGGFFDHVPPPAACDPAGPASAGTQRDYAFDQYGFRVPLILVSPFARRGYVSHYDADHTSILRFVQYWLRLPKALTYRDANAWPLLDMFDFDQTPGPFPVTLPLPSMTADQITSDDCGSFTVPTCP